MEPNETIKVVYAEDDEHVRGEISTYLRRRLKHVYEAKNGQEGLDLIHEHDPEIIITDLEMPIMNGLQMIDAVRTHSNGTRKIIVITGFNDEEHFTEKADAYLYKPISMHTLWETIQQYFPKATRG